jgi:DNA-binding transcriptional LysR family regulator
MNYTLNQLEVFMTVARLGSVTKAAEVLHLTQPAVSIQLRNFQDQFRIPLTEVIGRKIHVTEFGHEIARSAENILSQVNEINFTTKAYEGFLAGKLTISVVSTGGYVMPYFLAGFMKLHPGIELVMDVTNKSRVVVSLERNQVDFSLVSIIPDQLPVNKTDLLENKLYLVGGEGTTIPSSRDLHEIFRDLPMLFREEGSGTRQAMENFFRSHNLSVRKKMELTSTEAVKQAVLAGLGFSILPLIGINEELKTGHIRIFPVKGMPIITAWSLIWLRSKKLSPIAMAFLDYIDKEKQSVRERLFSFTVK